MKKQNAFRNNRGMTLVELLVGITILALIVSPLLHTFFTSANTANKSARLGLATTAAQNIVERMEATHMAGLTAAVNNGTAAALFGAASAQFYVEGDDEYIPAPSRESGEAKYDVVLKGLNYGSASFDALISLDASDHESNDVEITQYTPMDAVYAQPYGDDNPDHLAAEHFANEANKLASTSPVRSAAYFKDRLERSIDINLDVDPVTALVKVTAEFSYRNTYLYEKIIRNPNGTETFENAFELFTYSRRYEFYRGPLTGLSSIYFFYYPNYMADESYTPVRDVTRPGTGKDNLYINNQSDLEVSIFLIKQKTPGIENLNALSGMEKQYSADVMQYHSIGLWEAPAPVYSNLNRDVTGIEPLHVGFIVYRMYQGRDFYAIGQLNNKLVNTLAENRFYSLSVKLFDPGTDPFSDSAKPIYTIDASKLD